MVLRGRMHFTKFFSVVERDLEILNPTSHEKLMLLAEYCSVRRGDRVLDVGSGKGYMLRRWAERFRIEGTGVEINPSFVAQARSRASRGFELRGRRRQGLRRRCRRLRRGRLHRGAFRHRIVRGGRGVDAGCAQALWRAGRRRRVPPSPLSEEAAEREGVAGEDLRTLEQSAAVLEGHGLAIDGLIAASEDDWDRYASASWRAARAWAVVNSEDPDRVEILRMTDGPWWSTTLWCAS
jgi:SAM-dependent methyltransferase